MRKDERDICFLAFDAFVVWASRQGMREARAVYSIGMGRLIGDEIGQREGDEEEMRWSFEFGIARGLMCWIARISRVEHVCFCRPAPWTN